MAIVNFIPEVWSASLLVALRNQLTYAQAGVINRDYEGDIARAGDTVHLVNFTDPSVRSYTKYEDITWDTLSDEDLALVIDQSDYFAFKVDDVDKRQAMPGFVQATTTGASYNLANKADTYLSGIMKAGVGSDNALGATTIDSSTPSDAYDLLVSLRTLLTRANVPASGRFAIVPPELYGVLLHDARFVDASQSGSVDTLRNAVVGRAAGFDIVESNTAPHTTGTPGSDTVIAGHPMATTYAEQIAETEAIRLQSMFGDGIRGLHLYGAKVIRPKALATAEVTIS